MAFDHNKIKESFNTPELQKLYQSLSPIVKLGMLDSYTLNSYARTMGENIRRNLPDKFDTVEIPTLVFMLSEAIYDNLDESLIEKFTQYREMQNKSKEDLYDIVVNRIVYGVADILKEVEHNELLGVIDIMCDDI